MKSATQTTSFLLPGILIAAVVLGLAPASSSGAGKTQALFDGKDLGGWRKPTGDWVVAKSVSLDPADPAKFVIEPGQGIAVNGATGRTVEFVTEAEFGDVELHVEFCIPKHSNSGGLSDGPLRGSGL